MNNKQPVFQIILLLFIIVAALFRNCNAGDNFRDEFNFYDSSFWVTATHGIGDCKFKPENVNFVDSNLVLTVRDIPYWEGGELYSKKRYHYGSYCTRMKAAVGRGVVSAFFTYYYRIEWSFTLMVIRSG